MKPHLGFTRRAALLACLLASANAPAFAHGGEDHGDEAEAPAVVASTAAMSGATETELELRLSDLARLVD